MKNPLAVNAWMDALEWTPSTAESCVKALCAYLKLESRTVWLRMAPRIGAGLGCLADNPDELYRLAVRVFNESPSNERKLLASILASVNAALPERLVQEAIRTGALRSVLMNKSYSVAQRLAWLKEHQDYIFYQGGVVPLDADLETPIKDALMLRFFMAANRGGVPMLDWASVGLAGQDAGTTQFLEMNAPSLVAQIDIITGLGLSYQEAVDMLIDAGDGKMPEPLLDLPEMPAPLLER